MNIEIKHELGKKVYFVKSVSTPTFVKCSTCNGEGVLYRKIVNVDEEHTHYQETPCLKCNGTKVQTNGGSINEVVTDGIIDHITVEVNSKNNIYATPIDIIYFVEEPDSLKTGKYEVFHEIYLNNGLYDTPEEAETHVKKHMYCGYTTY